MLKKHFTLVGQLILNYTRQQLMIIAALLNIGDKCPSNLKINQFTVMRQKGKVKMLQEKIKINNSHIVGWLHCKVVREL